jgi:ABC-type glycerol-3-phosphate transport system permease component
MRDQNVVTLRTQQSFIYVVLVFFTLLAVLPLWLMLVNATRSTEEIQQGLSLLPSGHLMDNWAILTGRGFQIWQGFSNSTLIAFCATILSIYFSALTAYGLTIYTFRGRKPLFNLILALIAIPPQLGLIGFYRYMADLGLLNNYLPLILPAIAAPSTVFFLSQYIRGIVHTDLVDAARIDGSREFATFNRIILPILTPGLATMGIFTFVGTWNNFIMPYILISEKTMYTLPMLVLLLKTDIYKTEFGGIYLGIAVSVAPVLVFYAFASKFIISGVTVGSVKE